MYCSQILISGNLYLKLKAKDFIFELKIPQSHLLNFLSFVMSYRFGSLPSPVNEFS